MTDQNEPHRKAVDGRTDEPGHSIPAPERSKGRPVYHPDAKALAAGAKALRAQAHLLAPEANMWARGFGREHYMKRAHTEYTRLLRYADKLEELAGRRKRAEARENENG